MVVNTVDHEDDNKISFLNGQKVNIITDITNEEEDVKEVLEVKAVNYKDIVTKSQKMSEDESGRIRYQKYH